MLIQVLEGNLNDSDHVWDTGVGGKIIVIMIIIILIVWVFRNMDVGVWTGSICIRKGTLGRHL
jgi:hypothetical protein